MNDFVEQEFKKKLVAIRDGLRKLSGIVDDVVALGFDEKFVEAWGAAREAVNEAKTVSYNAEEIMEVLFEANKGVA